MSTVLQFLCNERMYLYTVGKLPVGGNCFMISVAFACWENLKSRCYLLETENRSESTSKDSRLCSDLQADQVEERGGKKREKMLQRRSSALVLLLTLQFGKNSFRQAPFQQGELVIHFVDIMCSCHNRLHCYDFEIEALLVFPYK